jgi:hypothetical protein
MMTVKVKCGIGYTSCSKTAFTFRGAPKKGKKGRNIVIARGSTGTATPGQTRKVTLKLTGAARKFFKDRTVRKRGKKKTVRGPKSLRTKVLIDNKANGFTNVRRVGRVK